MTCAQQLRHSSSHDGCVHIQWVPSAMRIRPNSSYFMYFLWMKQCISCFWCSFFFVWKIHSSSTSFGQGLFFSSSQHVFGVSLPTISSYSHFFLLSHPIVIGRRFLVFPCQLLLPLHLLIGHMFRVFPCRRRWEYEGFLLFDCRCSPPGCRQSDRRFQSASLFRYLY